MAYPKRRETKCCPLQVACDGTEIPVALKNCARCKETLRRREVLRVQAIKIQAEIDELARNPSKRIT